MAVTKIWTIKDSLQRVLDYAANPDKTEYDALAQTLHYAENDAKTKLNESAQLVTGIHCRVNHAWEDRFKLILKANNLPLDLNVHSLRHTNASLLIAQGVDVRTVASLLGHAQASTTLDIYAHAFDKNKRKAQEKLGKAIGL